MYGNQHLRTLYIPQSITQIDSFAFAMNDVLETVIIASKQIKLSSQTFYNCKQLKNVIISNATSIAFENNVFDKCNNLNEIFISKVGESYEK